MPKWLIYLLIIIVVAVAVYFLIPKKAMAPIPENNSTNSTKNSTANSQTEQASEKSEFANKQAKIKTSMGDITIEFFAADAPLAVENFIKLAQKDYYNGATFHRVVRDFVIQAGDPSGTGAGGESAAGGYFADELNPSTASYQAGYKKGVVAMANKGPNTNSSQFFIMLADRPLQHNYTIFGRVVSGQDVVDKIGLVITDPETDRPITAVTIKKVVIEDKK
ncbi:MAG: peptidylprolyl isomerase [Patescibacteria group bacterium]